MWPHAAPLRADRTAKLAADRADCAWIHGPARPLFIDRGQRHQRTADVRARAASRGASSRGRELPRLGHTAIDRVSAPRTTAFDAVDVGSVAVSRLGEIKQDELARAPADQRYAVDPAP